MGFTPSRIGVCLLLGVMTSLVVAWVLAVRVVVPVSPNARASVQGTYRGVDGAVWWYGVQERPGLTVVVRERGREYAFSSHGELVPAYHFPWCERWELSGMPALNGTAAARRSDIPAWARQPRAAPVAQPSFVITAASGRGWPCRALWYEATMTPTTRVNRGGIDLPPWFRDFGEGPVLPYRIIPVGLAVDSVLYGAAWMLLAAPRLLRRGVRRRHGLCAACGYDLRHAGHDRCPECGVTTAGDRRSPFELGLRAWASRSTSH